METRSYHCVVAPTRQTFPLVPPSRLFSCQHTCDTLKFRYEHESHRVCRGERIRDFFFFFNQKIEHSRFYTMNQPWMVFNTCCDSIGIPHYVIYTSMILLGTELVQTFCLPKRCGPLMILFSKRSILIGILT